MTRTRTFQGLAPEETRPRLDSESPKSGIRLVQPPPRVPRPSRPEPASAPPPPPSRRAAVKPRGDRAHVTLLPPAPSQSPPPAPPRAPAPAPSKPARAIPALTIPALTIPALPPAHERPAPTPSPIQFRSLITTAQDWVLVKPPPPMSPTFGMALRSSLHSLPAFLPPQELLGDPPPVTTDRVSVDRYSVRRISEGEMEVVRSRRAMDRRGRLVMAIAGFTLAFLAALVVVAFSRG